MGRPTKMPAYEVVKADVEAGMTNLALAEKYGVGESVVSSFLTNRGIKRKPKAFRPAVDDIAACVRKGMTLKQMSAELGGHPDVISRIIVKHKLREQKVEAGITSSVVRGPEAGPNKIVDDRGISLPRVPFIHGHFEVSA